MLYDFEYQLENVRERIRGIENGENAELIMKFLEKLFAEGLTKARVLKYANHLKVIAEKTDKTFTEWDEDEVVRFLSQLEQSEYSDYTKKDYKVVLKRFFRWLGKGELTEDVKTTIRNNKKKLPEDLLTKQEVKSMIETADHPRNKAMIAVLYEGGLRVGELASLRMRNVEFDDHGAVIKVKGKTGERRVRVVSSSSALVKWIEMHPDKENKDAPLWVNLSTNYEKKGITYQGISQRIKKIAKEAGIDKNVTPHVFRHSRATHLAGVLTEAEMNEYFGWVQGSDMPATYVHLSGRDVDKTLLKHYGIETKDENEKEEEFGPKECPRCGYTNGPTDRFCGRCGAVLNEEEAVKLQMRSTKLGGDFPDIAIEDSEVLPEMKKFIEMVELFKKKPELFKKMQAIVGEGEI